MAIYQVIFARSAARELSRLDRHVAERVLRATEKLAADPRPVGCAKLTGSQNDWRIRVGDWRVLYTIDDAARVVDVAAVRHRREAYR
jgi:mRNA interferase RelE/StbE